MPKGKWIVNAVDVQDNKDAFVKIVPIGDFPEHWMGPFKVTKNDVDSMAANFANSGTDILFDFEHDSIFGQTRAAGWSAEVEARDDGLYIKYPEFTVSAQQMVDDREYRYFSPVIGLNVRDKNGKTIGAVLDSVALTNKPYFDHEIEHIQNSNKNKENDMYSADYKKELGLPEDASDEAVEAKVKKLNELVADGAKLANPPAEKPKSEEGEGKSEERKEKSDETQVAVNSAVLKSLESITNRLDARDATETRVQAEALVNSAIADFKISASDKDVWLNSAMSDYAKTKTDLDARKRGTVMPAKLKTNSAAANSEEITKENFRKVPTGQVFANAADYLRMQGR